MISTAQTVILSLQMAQKFDGHRSYISNEINRPTNTEVTILWYINNKEKIPGPPHKYTSGDNLFSSAPNRNRLKVSKQLSYVCPGVFEDLSVSLF